MDPLEHFATIQHGFCDNSTNDQECLLYVRAIGHERHVCGNHVVVGSHRISSCDSARQIFLITMSGEGAVDWGGTTYRIRPHQACLLEKSGMCQYSVSEGASHWEFKWMEIAHAHDYWRQMIESAGTIVELSPHGPTMQFFEEINVVSQHRAMKDGYDNAAYAFRFLMKLRQEIREQTGATTHAAISRCLDYIDQNLHLPMNLSDLLHISQLTRTQFYELFARTMGETPQQYLNKARIRRAVQLLTSTSLSIEQTAKCCGYANGNYLAKVFRKYVGKSPQKIRSEASYKFTRR
jgi:YesN/AraC family two-component response regulator